MKKCSKCEDTYCSAPSDICINGHHSYCNNKIINSKYIINELEKEIKHLKTLKKCENCFFQINKV